MIRVLIQYPVDTNARFDLAYYRDKHVSLVRRVMTALGMVKGEWDEVLAHAASGGPAKYHVVSVQYWESLQSMELAYASPNTLAVRDDVKNFYSGTPVRIISNLHA
jgi:uncharacterized protein (TIGR02118 family)